MNAIIRLSKILVKLLLTMGITLFWGGNFTAPLFAEEAALLPIYLPSVQNRTNGTATETPTPPPPPRQGKGLFPESDWRTGSSAVAVDKENGVHFAYVYTKVLYGTDPEGGGSPTAAIYRFCQSACENLQNWSSVELSENVSEA
jgi:hypothetical protein